MKLSKRTLFSIVVAIGLAMGLRHSFAQVPMAPASNGIPASQKVFVRPGEKQEMFFTIRVRGIVTGRVLESSSTDFEKGVSGAKVILRSRDLPFRHWFSEQYTDEAGNYRYEDLRPGDYTIEIGPLDRPDPSLGGQLSMPSQRVNAASTGKGTLTGTVFIDKDRNGKYDANKDLAVAGALIAGHGRVTRTDAFGLYTLTDVPLGRVSLSVQWPHRQEKTFVSLDLAAQNGARNVDIYPVH